LFSLRLKNKFNHLGISEEMAELAMETPIVYYFKQQEVPIFLSYLNYIVKVCDLIGIPILELHIYILKRQNK
jgi:hypothetical protein